MSAESKELLDKMEEKLDSLLRGNGEELQAYLTKIDAEIDVVDTKAKVYCYIISHDGNDRPRVKDLAKAVASRVTEYAIPRSEIAKAYEYMIKHNSPAKFYELQAKAKSLFTTLKKTGEGGEMLLYMLAQSQLGLPQILCKMSLKTSSQLHYNGSDAIHMTFDKTNNKLALYWGEAKLYESITSAVTSCLDSIRPFLCDDGGSDGSQMRDLQLINSFIDLGDPELEEALLRFLNPDDPMFNKLQYRAVCLIGFNDTTYPIEANSKSHEQVSIEIAAAISNWQSQIGTKLKDRAPLHNFHMEIFLVPFPSVSEYREFFLGEVKNG
ncbi:DUF1837 domain-containing protein [Paenibacillus sp. LHD-38]|uniref:HamA C-terminal domain-containing protein n=1 Tax=Paenibacillus sp. LHD-38 TaxID=3072143 RepID=UPI00280CEB0C|nr:DUF1837 domain-containing protein [Paenibacillus sp. LHD-38]MDQ8738244.1 DUF1837 domain-containing protein [Paenibacillus sp. LHD-38]